MIDEPNDHEPTLEAMVKEVKQRLDLLAESLPRQIDPIGLSRTKLPFKVLNCREALIWRMDELARVSFQAFQARQFAAAIILTRAAVETVAALWYLEEKVSVALNEGKLADLDTYVMRLLSGNYLWAEFPDPLRVRKFIECVERRVPGFKDEYNRLSEYAHPNSSGTVGLYSTIDRENILIDFGLNKAGVNAAQIVCIANLSVALTLFEHSYNKLGDMLHDFIKLCETEIPPLNTSQKG